jgi:hypothetical protein
MLKGLNSGAVEGMPVGALKVSAPTVLMPCLIIGAGPPCEAIALSWANAALNRPQMARMVSAKDRLKNLFIDAPSKVVGSRVRLTKETPARATFLHANDAVFKR